MFSHVMVGVSDIERSKKFYDAVFEPLGIGPGVDNAGRYFYISPNGIFAITIPIDGEPANRHGLQATRELFYEPGEEHLLEVRRGEETLHLELRTRVLL